VLSEVSAMGR